MPKVSMVVCVYNGQNYIETCIKCILAQTYEDYEAIIVDDGSTDNSAKLLDEMALIDPRIRVIHQVNQGISSARNAGIKAATGEYICFMDVDDIVEPTLLEDNYRLAKQHDADVVMYCFKYFFVDKKEEILNGMDEVFVGDRFEYFNRMLCKTIDNEVFNAPWNKLIRRILLIDNEVYFEPRYQIYEDIIFVAKLLQYTDKVVINNLMYYTYYLKSSGSLLTKFSENYFDSVSLFYSNVMEYCSKYENNEQQVARCGELYASLVYTHLKQISNEQTIDDNKKKELMLRICSDRSFLTALNAIHFTNNKKKIMRWLINHKMTKAICLIYERRFYGR